MVSSHGPVLVVVIWEGWPQSLWIIVINGSFVFRPAVKTHFQLSAYFKQICEFFLKAPISLVKLTLKKEGNNVWLYNLPNITDQNLSTYTGLEKEFLCTKKISVTLEKDVEMILMLN